MIKFKTAFTAIMWSEILLQFSSVSKYLQKPGIDLFTAVNLLKGLKTYVSSLREKFVYFENKAKELSINILPCGEKIVRKKKFSDGTIEGNSNLCEIRKLEVDTFYVIIDCLVTELDIRLNALIIFVVFLGLLKKLVHNYYQRLLPPYSLAHLKMILIQ